MPVSVLPPGCEGAAAVVAARARQPPARRHRLGHAVGRARTHLVARALPVGEQGVGGQGRPAGARLAGASDGELEPGARRVGRRVRHLPDDELAQPWGHRLRVEELEHGLAAPGELHDDAQRVARVDPLVRPARVLRARQRVERHRRAPARRGGGGHLADRVPGPDQLPGDVLALAAGALVERHPQHLLRRAARVLAPIEVERDRIPVQAHVPLVAHVLLVAGGEALADALQDGDPRALGQHLRGDGRRRLLRRGGGARRCRLLRRGRGRGRGGGRRRHRRHGRDGDRGVRRREGGRFRRRGGGLRGGGGLRRQLRRGLRGRLGGGLRRERLRGGVLLGADPPEARGHQEREEPRQEQDGQGDQPKGRRPAPHRTRTTCHRRSRSLSVPGSATRARPVPRTDRARPPPGRVLPPRAPARTG